MHLMATYLPFLMHCALSTSEKVPSPFLPISRYSGNAGAGHTPGEAEPGRAARTGVHGGDAACEACTESLRPTGRRMQLSEAQRARSEPGLRAAPPAASQSCRRCTWPTVCAPLAPRGPRFRRLWHRVGLPVLSCAGDRGGGSLGGVLCIRWRMSARGRLETICEQDLP